MRCPKCGYISFDNVDECLKCKKNIKSASEVLQGSVLKVAPPSFLKFRGEPKKSKKTHSDFSDEISPVADYADDEPEFSPSDINISEDVDGEIEIMSGGLGTDHLQTETAHSSLEAEEEVQDGDIEVDLSQFEEVSDPEAAFLSDESEESLAENADVIEISMPEELSDMSDLDPPGLDIDAGDLADLDLNLDLDSESDDLNLDDLNFDLALDDVEVDRTVSEESVQETVLALDDIDFSDALSDDGDDDLVDKSLAMDMDSDLDFDLDLGGLSIHKDV
ncbi:hypothetical protein [Desulforhopalus sp. IMCC35007]|uniref:hypothetical protein n=1 Tax=Desulforhopalus sp. IMCC35007 TaxID=2569543 RepID=UPI0010ADB60B|nr:hypothetical protein [Desulforhopalus sp. IMCC35007]TKB05745.1 hypothetical protein FCL48_23700 [Desulforhopalus sp. IMCC35007]